MTCEVERLGLGQKQKLGQVDEVLESPKQRLGTRMTKGNLSIKGSIEEVA
jgi:hypothetical protein